MLVLAENKSEGIQHFVGAQPDIARFAGCDGRLEDGSVGCAYQAVDAIAGNQQIESREGDEVFDFAVELNGHAQFSAAPLQDAQQCLARDAGNDMTAAANGFSAIAGINGVPDDKAVGDLLIGGKVCALEGGQCTIRKDDTPAIGHIRRVALNNCDVVRRIGLLNQDTCVETRRSTAKNNDFHT